MIRLAPYQDQEEAIATNKPTGGQCTQGLGEEVDAVQEPTDEDFDQAGQGNWRLMAVKTSAKKFKGVRKEK